MLAFKRITKKTVANNVKEVWQDNLSIHVVFSLKNHPPFTAIQ